jgi:diguanylate cyclase (GGDEF)-like protein
MRITLFLEKRGKVFFSILGFLSIVLVGYIDAITGYELGLSLFYLLPIAILAWYVGTWIGLFGSAACALAWLLADLMAGHPFTSILIPAWNTGIRLGIFIVVGVTLSAFRKSIERGKVLVRTDYLTGAISARYFRDVLSAEIERSTRYERAFTVAYVDLDDFKTVNDNFGHDAGDGLLRLFAEISRGNLRKSDIVARLGGDEFAFLLPETGRVQARAAVKKVRTKFLKEMRARRWSVTMSVGVFTCSGSKRGIDEILRAADGLMYEVKNSGKDAVKFSSCR